MIDCTCIRQGAQRLNVYSFVFRIINGDSNIMEELLLLDFDFCYEFDSLLVLEG